MELHIFIILRIHWWFCCVMWSNLCGGVNTSAKSPGQPIRAERDNEATNERRGSGLVEHLSRPEQEPGIVFWRNGVDTTQSVNLTNERSQKVTLQPIRRLGDADWWCTGAGILNSIISEPVHHPSSNTFVAWHSEENLHDNRTITQNICKILNELCRHNNMKHKHFFTQQLNAENGSHKAEKML